MRFALGMLILASMPCIALAGKKAAPKISGKDWNGPYIELRLSARFAKYLDRYDDLMEDRDEILSIDNESKRKKKEDAWKDSLKDIREDLAKKVEMEARSYKRELDKIEKALSAFDKQRERGGSEKAMEALEQKEAVVMKKQKQLSGALAALKGFESYCSGNRKNIAGTAFANMEMMAPPIKGKTIDAEDFDLAKLDGAYKVIVFFSKDNRDSLTGARELSSLDGRKIRGKLVEVVYVSVDRGEEDAEKQKAELKKVAKKGPVLVDEKNDLCAQYHVGFLPHAVLVDRDNVVRAVAMGPQVRKRITDKIDKLEKPKRKR